MGGKYIPMQYRDEPEPTKRTAAKFRQLLVAVPTRCDHLTRICPTRECVDSWAMDHRLFLTRNVTGREFIRVMRLTDEEIASLSEDTPPKGTRSIAPEPISRY